MQVERNKSDIAEAGGDLYFFTWKLGSWRLKRVHIFCNWRDNEIDAIESALFVQCETNLAVIYAASTQDLKIDIILGFRAAIFSNLKPRGQKNPRKAIRVPNSKRRDIRPSTFFISSRVGSGVYTCIKMSNRFHEFALVHCIGWISRLASAVRQTTEKVRRA